MSVPLRAPPPSRCDLMVLCFSSLLSLKDPRHFDVRALPPVMANQRRRDTKCFWWHPPPPRSASLRPCPRHIPGISTGTTWRSLNHNRKLPKVTVLSAAPPAVGLILPGGGGEQSRRPLLGVIDPVFTAAVNIRNGIMFYTRLPPGVRHGEVHRWSIVVTTIRQKVISLLTKHVTRSAQRQRDSAAAATAAASRLSAASARRVTSPR